MFNPRDKLGCGELRNLGCTILGCHRKMSILLTLIHLSNKLPEMLFLSVSVWIDFFKNLGLAINQTSSVRPSLTTQPLSHQPVLFLHIVHFWHLVFVFFYWNIDESRDSLYPVFQYSTGISMKARTLYPAFSQFGNNKIYLYDVAYINARIYCQDQIKWSNALFKWQGNTKF